jgi:hypothetical protein
MRGLFRFIQLALLCDVGEDSRVIRNCARLRDVDFDMLHLMKLEHESLRLCASALKFRILGLAGAGTSGVVFKVCPFSHEVRECAELCRVVTCSILSVMFALARQATYNQPGHADPRRVYALKMIFNMDATTTNGILTRSEVGGGGN